MNSDILSLVQTPHNQTGKYLLVCFLREKAVSLTALRVVTQNHFQQSLYEWFDGKNRIWVLTSSPYEPSTWQSHLRCSRDTRTTHESSRSIWRPCRTLVVRPEWCGKSDFVSKHMCPYRLIFLIQITFHQSLSLETIKKIFGPSQPPNRKRLWWKLFMFRR